MIATLSRTTPVLVQGISGRMGRAHTASMRATGTNIVAGTATRTDVKEIDGIPVFPDCAAAVAATGATASIAMVPAAEIRAAVFEALAANIRLIVTIAEGVPVHDALAIGRAVRTAGATWIGPSTPGLAVPGEMKLGFLPDAALRPGPIAIMSKSGTLSYEIGWRLAQSGLGQSLWIGVGGDPVKGLRFADLLAPFQSHPATQAIVLVGEVGGDEEEQFAAALTQFSPTKPVFAVIAGSEAKEGVAMGHAGALTFGATGTVTTKRAALEAAGVKVFATMAGLVSEVARARL